jgi:hypothetical protein
MLNRKTVLRHGLLLGGLALGLLTAPSPGRAEVLYKLETTCTIKGGAPVPCSVEAMNEGPSTLYLHKIGTATETIRVTDSPVRMSRWIPATKEWQSLQQAGARFSSNTVCFNGLDLCVVNPNYLNSVRQDNATAMATRDLVRVHFDDDGRINITCYDEGCALIQKTAAVQK